MRRYTRACNYPNVRGNQLYPFLDRANDAIRAGAPLNPRPAPPPPSCSPSVRANNTFRRGEIVPVAGLSCSEKERLRKKKRIADNREGLPGEIRVARRHVSGTSSGVSVTCLCGPSRSSVAPQRSKRLIDACRRHTDRRKLDTTGGKRFTVSDWPRPTHKRF